MRYVYFTGINSRGAIASSSMKFCSVSFSSLEITCLIEWFVGVFSGLFPFLLVRRACWFRLRLRLTCGCLSREFGADSILCLSNAMLPSWLLKNGSGLALWSISYHWKLCSCLKVLSSVFPSLSWSLTSWWREVSHFTCFHAALACFRLRAGPVWSI